MWRVFQELGDACSKERWGVVESDGMIFRINALIVKEEWLIEKQHWKARGPHTPSPGLVVSKAEERKQTSLERAAREVEKYQTGLKEEG